MPEFRSDMASMPVYKPGRPIEEVARELGLPDIVKIASNESPLPPFPETQEVMARVVADVNRYPETDAPIVVDALAEHHGIPPEHLWVAGGSTSLIGCMTLAVGGPGTNNVFADPSFVMYRIATLVAGSEPVAVPVDTGYRHDLEAMADAVGPDTRIAFICNPNNPTGTHVPADAVTRFIERVPDHVLIVVDEAYIDYVTAPDYATAFPYAMERDNVVVTRTFSKVYGLAGLRIGYGIGNPDTLAVLRRTQPPFTITNVAQAAAVESLRHPHRVAERVELNTAGRRWLIDELAQRGVDVAPSQTNFVFVVPDDSERVTEALLQRGVIVRRLGPYLRITVGTAEENRRLIAAWDDMEAS